jgi:hypothetical protein
MGKNKIRVLSIGGFFTNKQTALNQFSFHLVALFIVSQHLRG